MTLRKLHRINALLLGVFIFAHLINHITLVFGVETHLKTMEALRFFYRPFLVEMVLYILFGCQILLGLAMMLRRRRAKNSWTWAQYISGGILTLFLVQHMSAAFATRAFNPDVDTNIYWAAAVVSREPFVWYFAPYYALGLFSIFVHVAAALRKRGHAKVYANGLIALGALVTAIVVPSLMGWYSEPINLPPEHVRYIENFFPSF